MTNFSEKNSGNGAFKQVKMITSFLPHELNAHCLAPAENLSDTRC